MLSVANKPFRLSVIMPNVIMLNVVAPQNEGILFQVKNVIKIVYDGKSSRSLFQYNFVTVVIN